MVRFDKHLTVVSANDEKTRFVAGFPALHLQDLPTTVPETSFNACSCLREGIVRITCCVIEANAFSPKTGLNLGKALLQETVEGVCWQAELIAFADQACQVSSLQVGRMYVLTGVAIQPSNDKNGFAFKWVKGSGANILEEPSGGDAGSFSGKSAKMLSNRPAGSVSSSLSQARAIYVSASTLDCLLPSSGCRAFDNSEVWEVPWVTVIDINARRSAEAWHSSGCSECYKSACSQHRGVQRRCYAIDVQFVDHTGMLEAKMFTAQADEMFAAAGFSVAGSLEPEQQQTALESLRSCNFAVRLAIMEDDPWQNRAARNYFQVIKLRQQPQTWNGTVNSLLHLAADGKCGLPAMLAKEIYIDAAEQIKGPKDSLLDCVEMLVCIGEAKPENRQENDETGLRVNIEAFDYADESHPKIVLTWLASVTALLDLARELLPNAMFRIIARPVIVGGAIEAWQVLQHSSNVNVKAWMERLHWQRQEMDADGSRKRLLFEDFVQQTPNSKVQCVRKALASPSYTAA
eukprot:Skav211540  [mRNA]  locus=scaffold352:485240:486793:+ [translate_table: standard]